MGLHMRRKTWAILIVALIGAPVAWFLSRDAQKSPSHANPETERVAKTDKASAATNAFDFYLMAMTVHAAFCADGHSRLAECSMTVSQRPLVIHGLWPERNEPRAYPRDCPAAPLELDPGLAMQLADYMPGMADLLHEYEWREHGGCSGLDDDEYFNHALRLARGVDAALSARLTTLAGEETTPAALREVVDAFQPGLGATLTFHCRTLRDARSARPHLIEVRQCVDNDGPKGAPGTAMDCGAVKRRDQGCGQSFLIATRQGR
jgi:ribonuclease T2